MADLSAVEALAVELAVPDVVRAALGIYIAEEKIRFFASMPGWRDRKLGPARLLIESYHQWLDEHGWQIIPKVPTAEMADEFESREGAFVDFSERWADMLAVAPKPEVT